MTKFQINACWESRKISYFFKLGWKAGKPVLFSDREARKAGISTFEKTSSIVFWSG